MDQKIKFALIGLIAAALIFFGLFITTFSAKQTVTKERDDLKQQNASLEAKVNSSIQENKRLQERFNSLSQEADRVAREKDDIQRKFSLISKERDDLAEKLKSTQEAPQKPSLPAGASADAFWAEVLKNKTDLEMQLNSAREELKNIQITNEQLQRDKSSLQLDISNLNNENLDLKRQLDYNQKITDSVSQDLVREKGDKMKLQDTLKTLKNENIMFKKELDGLSNRKIELEKKLAELQSKNTGLCDKIKEMDGTLKSYLLQIDNLNRKTLGQQSSMQAVSMDNATAQKDAAKGCVDLPPIVVRPQAAAGMGAGKNLSGKIVNINKDSNFAIVDLGEDSGVRLGDTFSVYRGENKIANLEVIKTIKNASACDIKKETTPLAIGDIVK